MNLHEVANRARVSASTVSRVLNNTPLVKGSTRARVIRAIEELKYHPNLHARSLARGRSRSIGVIVSNIENPFFLDIYKTVEASAHSAGYEIIMANTDYRSEQLVSSIRLMIGHRVAGLAIMASEIDPALIEQLGGDNIPVVFYDIGSPRKNITNVRVNYPRGIEKLVDYLHALGHRRLGLVGHQTILGQIDERSAVVLDRITRYAGLVVETAGGTDSLEGGRRAARTVLNARANLTAILCVNDVMAVGALRELRERGMRVPQDISVTGFDDIDLAQFCSPALTSIHIPRQQIGKTICHTLIDRQDADAPAQEVVIEPELVVRDSTGPAPG